MKQLLILFLAAELFTNFSQSLLGPFEFSDVIISTMSPLFNGVSIGIILLFILQPTIWWPISAWIEYAKSIVISANAEFSGKKTYGSMLNDIIKNYKEFN